VPIINGRDDAIDISFIAAATAALQEHVLVAQDDRWDEAAG
jgi:hypothetical protein